MRVRDDRDLHAPSLRAPQDSSSGESLRALNAVASTPPKGDEAGAPEMASPASSVFLAPTLAAIPLSVVDRFARRLTGPTSGPPLTPMGAGDISIALARRDAAFRDQFERNHELILREEPR
jgi:hypothetical protein